MELIILAFALIVIAVGAVIALKILTSGAQMEQPLPYRAKKYFFSRSEQEFLRILNESIDRQKYTIFPKVRLADFVEVTASGKEYQGWWNKIRSKHVDFLVWNVPEGKVALAIELDGKSHQSEKMIARDAFVEKLYERVEIKLVRVVVGSSFAGEREKINLLLSH